ncbi:hypothetical protein GCM10012280_61840 [Wenjunlia tyrosinilytica]|uniref:Uncharacterized protein n=1 Tax=Wenjunlia tyrosinilytica TaxID=1544741 RepID=A0A917ZXX4_9ACTN|nr:hypothetical protein GCM10012280_61840 [Wenjunlia tyrosinilytica]
MRPEDADIKSALERAAGQIVRQRTASEGRTRLEVDIPAQATAETWTRLLAVLNGRSWGASTTPDGTATVWTHIYGDRQ